MIDHLDEDELSRYAEGIDDQEERTLLQAHLNACADCRGVIAELVRCPRSPGELPSSDPFEGLHVGRYQLGARLGAGAMGVVYRARDPILQRDVALKLVRNLDLPESRDQLVAAARAMAKIEHKNVLPVFDAGVDGDEVFVVSALAEGGDLRGWIVNTPGLQLGAAFVGLAEGLAAVHEAGLLHRDIKPDNILVAGDNSLLLADVGFAATSAPSAITPAYLAPELLTGSAPSPAADQYALALSLCEAFTGKRSGNASDASRDMKRAGAPRHLLAAVQRGLAADPSQRFPDATRFAEALRGRRRVGAWLVAAALVMTAAVIGGVAIGSKSESSATCIRAVDDAARVWRDREFFLTKHFSARATSWTPLAKQINGQLGRLQSSRELQCAAAKRGEESAHVRIACLTDRARKLETLVGTLGGLAPDALVEGRVLAAILPDVADCEQGSPAMVSAPPPAIAQKVLALRSDIERARVVAWLGDLEGAGKYAQETLKSAQTLGSESVVAAAYELLGQVAYFADTEREARDAFERAAEAAERSGDDALRARALIAQLSLASLTYEEGQDIAERAEAIVERTGSLELRVFFATHYGRFLLTENHLEDSASRFAEALALQTQLYGESSPRLAAHLGNLGTARNYLGEHEEARELYQQQLDLARDFAGPDHPTVARAIGSLASLTDNAESVALLQEALRIFRSAFGEEHRDTVQALTNLCAAETYVDPATADVTCRDAVAAAERVEGSEAAALAWPLTARGRQLLMADRFEEAREHLDRGLRLAVDGSGLLPMEVANLRYYLAAALAKTNTDLPRALELAKAAKAEWLTSPRMTASAQGADSLIKALEAELAKR